MDSLILISHGNFSKELKKSAEMILGPQEMIHTVSLLLNEGEEEFTEKFEAVTKSLDDNFVVFADLMGGTPCNIASKKLLNGAQFDLYAGMSMPMVISFINASLIGNTQNLVGEAQQSIVKVNDLLAADDFDEEDE